MSSRIVFLHLVPLFLFAQAYREEGMAFLRNYAPKEYDAASQNFAIAQDHRGVMYFGNGDGVLEYDGVSWRLVADSKGLVVRSMGVDEKGTVFVGGMGDFGYLTPDRSGTLHFVSLLDRLET